MNEKNKAEEIKVKGNDTEETLDAEEQKEVESKLLPLVEAMLFVYGEPLPLSRILEVTNLKQERVEEALEELQRRYLEDDTSGLQLVAVGKKNDEPAYQLRSKADFGEVLRKLKAGRPRRLSKPALETLSIVAYRQPVVKSDVDKIRGVDSAPTMKTLVDKGLIKIIGHQASVGQPALYATTEEFLSLFALKSLSDLPTLRELKELDEEPGEALELPLGEQSQEGQKSAEEIAEEQPQEEVVQM